MEKKKVYYGWIMVPLLGIIYLLNVGFPFIGASVINTYMVAALNLERSTLGLGYTVYGLVGGLCSPLIAFSIRKKGIRFTLLVGSFMVFLGSLLMGSVVSNSWQYVIVFGLLIGLGTSFGSTIPVQTGITLWFTKKKSLAMSLAITIGSLGGFVAPPTLYKIISLVNGDWRMAWFAIVALMMVSSTLTILFAKNKPADIGLAPYGENGESPATDEKKTSGGRQVYRCSDEWKAADALRTPTFWILFVASLAMIGPMMVFIAHTVMYLKDMGHTPAIAAMAMSYYMMFSLAGRMVGGALGDRFEPRYIWAVGLLLEAAGIFCFLDARSVSDIYIFTFLLGIGVGASTICMPTMIGNYFGANSFASVIGVLFPIVQLLAATAPFFAGMVYDVYGSYVPAFVTCAVLACMGSVLIFFIKPPKFVAGRSQPALAS